MEIECAKSCDTCDALLEYKAKERQQLGGMSAEEILSASERFGVRQVASGEHRLDALLLIQKTIDYLKDKESCRNEHENCSCKLELYRYTLRGSSISCTSL